MYQKKEALICSPRGENTCTQNKDPRKLEVMEVREEGHQGRCEELCRMHLEKSSSFI